MYENEFLFLCDANDVIVDKFCKEHGKLKTVSWRPFKTELLGAVKPLNPTQELGFYML